MERLPRATRKYTSAKIGLSVTVPPPRGESWVQAPGPVAKSTVHTLSSRVPSRGEGSGAHSKQCRSSPLPSQEGGRASCVEGDAQQHILGDSPRGAVGEDDHPPRRETAEGVGLPIVAVPPRSNHLCPHCARQFTTFTGRRLHERKAHPDLFHAEAVRNLPPSKRARWDQQEVMAMATWEANHPEAANDDIQAQFPHRTVDAIKGRRKLATYRQLVDSIRQEGTPGGNSVRTSPMNVTRRTRLRRETEEAGMLTASGHSRPTIRKRDREPLGELLELAKPRGDQSPSGGGVHEEAESERAPEEPRVSVSEGRVEPPSRDGGDGARRASGEPFRLAPPEGNLPSPPRTSESPGESVSWATIVSQAEVMHSDGDAPVPDRRVHVGGRRLCRPRPEGPAPRDRGRDPFEGMPKLERQDNKRSEGSSLIEDLPDSMGLLKSTIMGILPSLEWNPKTAQIPKEVGECPPPKQTKPLSKRVKARRQFAAVQTAYKTNRSRCINDVLRGRDFLARRPLLPKGTRRFWTELFSGEGASDNRITTGKDWGPQPDLFRRVSSEEVDWIKGAMKPTAKGLDEVGVADLKNVELKRLLDALLGLRELPEVLCLGRTALIPKVDVPAAPGDFRPITVTSCVTRTLHRLIARRLGEQYPLPSYQKGFRKEEGVTSLVLLLQELINNAKTKYSSLYVAFIDFKKAFDSVSHESVKVALERHGLPQSFIDYIGSYYKKIHLHLCGRKVKLGKGVLQGDPLSPMLFNIVLDLVLREVKDHRSPTLEGTVIPYAAYADDVVLISTSPEGLSQKIQQLMKAGKKVGLVPGFNKCATLGILGNKRRKGWYHDSRTIPLPEGDFMKALGPQEWYKYLGTATGTDLTVSPKQVQVSFVTDLQKLSRAPLKPQQRLWALKSVLLPKMNLPLIIFKKGARRRMDAEVRKFVRKTLHLPHDTPIGAFYAPLKEGGLQLRSLTSNHPIQRRNMLFRMRSSPDKIISSIGEKRLQKEFPSEFTTSPASLLKREKSRWAEVWQSSFDGVGTKGVKICPAECSSWIDSGTRLMKGGTYCQAIKLRLGSLSCGTRRLRGGRPGTATCKNGCGRIESLGHILQSCNSVHNYIVARHDNVLNYIGEHLGKNTTLSFKKEPTIRVHQGVFRPDLVVWNEERSWVTDVQVCSDGGAHTLTRAHCLKVSKYNLASISEEVRKITGHQPEYGSVTLDWRGYLHPPSRDTLREWNFSNSTVELMVVKSIEGSIRVYAAFQGTSGGGDVW